jgi:hypothetical protein
MEQNRRDIMIDPCVLGQEQRIAVSPPILVEAGQYVGMQNRSSETVSGFEYASTRGGMYLPLDDVGVHGQYIWKFEGGLERVSHPLRREPVVQYLDGRRVLSAATQPAGGIMPCEVRHMRSMGAYALPTRHIDTPALYDRPYKYKVHALGGTPCVCSVYRTGRGV